MMPKPLWCAIRRVDLRCHRRYRRRLAVVAGVMVGLGMLPVPLPAQQSRRADPRRQQVPESRTSRSGPVGFADLRATRELPESREFRTEGYLILNGRKGHTLIPEGGVLHLPRAHRKQVAAERPEGPIQSWRVFLQENRDWLGAQEVPMTVARGAPSLLEPILARLAGERRVIVSTYRQQPVGILHPVEDESATAAPTAKP